MKNEHWLDHIVGQMNKLIDSTGIAIDAFGHDSMPGSIASEEIQSSDDPNLVKAAYVQGSMMTQVIMDHFSSITRSITQPVLTISPWTTLRSIMESSAIGIWLLSINIGLDERISRSMKFRCEGLLQQKKFGRVLGTESEFKSISDRHKEVLNEAKNLGLELKFDKKGNPKEIKKRMPSITNLIAEHLDKEGDYRLLSAVAHAHPWALQNLSFKIAKVPRNLFLEKSLSPVLINYIGDLVFIISKAPIIEKCRLFGWPHEGIDQIFINAHENFSTTLTEVIGTKQ